jgi:putative membrane protein
VVLLHELKIKVDLGFDVHIFAQINAIINGTVASLLLLGLYFVKAKKYVLHKKVMNLAILLSLLFLLSYIAHHILADSTSFNEQGTVKYIYYIILISHILLAGLSLPFILFTAYRGSISEFPAHKKMAKYVFPVWLYVAITGVVVYLMISPFYR